MNINKTKTQIKKIEPRFTNIIRLKVKTQKNILKIQKNEGIKYKNDAVAYAIDKLADSYVKNNRSTK